MYDENENDVLYAKAVVHVRTTGKVSISNLQRNLVIGYNRAARLIERMEADGELPDEILTARAVIAKAKGKTI